MRTTLDIDDDLLAAARELARRERKSTGQVVSELMRKGLAGSAHDDDPGMREAVAFYGLRPLPPRGVVVTNEDVNRLREELGI